ncbi:hypothetical protein HRE53_17425 [Acaryochloris sp. 'Moss Beach']|uniref:hypothetical protein n=1 Tax=Acaryochloris sp. 'Moss Beach' TaxID=2740837 RepID=UPI001F2EBE8D|nr:hypothetical protein [Acaryochloris sp. 'Moss Beach']UJB68323.1 hypothetical protein HRE53_17425 [Acaryochloris sp. 'Moss Beach']
MIRIDKPKTAPQKLTTDGETKSKSHINDYKKASGDYQSGTKTFSFSNKIYGHKSVKEALIRAQHKKCCFCERLVGDDGDVEHFRPKSAYIQKKGEKLNRPGYYWLAYEWDNLYLSCSACNQRQKRNLFPLVDPTTRAHSHTDDINLEDPLFVNPGIDEPSQHIDFRGEVPYPINGSIKGKPTIESLNLNRSILNEARLKHLQVLKNLHKFIKVSTGSQNQELQNLAVDAQQTLMDAISDRGEFAAATRAALKDEFQFVPE